MKGAITTSVSAAELVHDPGRVMDLAANRPVRVVRDDGDELLVLGVESDLKVGQVGIEAAIAVGQLTVVPTGWSA